MQKAIQQAAGEAGDEAAAAECLRGREAERRECNDRDVLPMLARPAKSGGEPKDRDRSARQGKTCEQIAAELGQPVGTVKSSLSRAYKALRSRMSRPGDEDR